MSATLSPATLARLAKMRRDQRVQAAVFGLKVFGPAAIFLAVLWWSLR